MELNYGRALKGDWVQGGAWDGVCVRGEGGYKFHQVKNNNLHVKIRFSVLPNLFLFNPIFKCMQVLVKAKNLNTFRLHI